MSYCSFNLWCIELTVELYFSKILASRARLMLLDGQPLHDRFRAVLRSIDATRGEGPPRLGGTNLSRRRAPPLPRQRRPLARYPLRSGARRLGSGASDR